MPSALMTVGSLPQYIAIDQGPIVVMIADWRSGLLRDCFMRNEDVQTGLTGLGFSTSSSEACLDLLPELDLSIPPQPRSFFQQAVTASRSTPTEPSVLPPRFSCRSYRLSWSVSAVGFRYSPPSGHRVSPCLSDRARLSREDAIKNAIPGEKIFCGSTSCHAGSSGLL